MKVCTICDVAFNSPHCPVCQAAKLLEEKDKELAAKDEKIWNLEGTVADLEYKMEKLQGAQ